MYGETEVVRYEGAYFECKMIENGYILSNDDKELEVDNNEMYCHDR
jgi:hypothetical protein